MGRQNGHQGAIQGHRNEHRLEEGPAEGKGARNLDGPKEGAESHAVGTVILLSPPPPGTRKRKHAIMPSQCGDTRALRLPWEWCKGREER